MICCVCENKCKGDLVRLIREGCDTIQKFRDEHGVAGRCGKCTPYVQEYIEEEIMRQDIEKLVQYMEGHSSRLNLDIANSQKRHDGDKEEFYKGAKGATEMFLRMTKDVLERNK
jgi:NAD(P)H-nitrite reductase large subunit